MNNENNKDINEFEKQLSEINEWQNNANNPGYFIGSGKVPVPLKNLLSPPVVMLLAGIVLLIPVIFNLTDNFSLINLLSNPVGIVISIALIVCGSIRLIRKG